jgi:hypothetical protein
VISFSLISIFFLRSDLGLVAVCLCFLITFVLFFCHLKALRYQKKINEIERKIVEELSKS